MSALDEHHYPWKDTDLTNAHTFLLAPITAAVQRAEKSERRLLDLGCGNGAMSRHFAQLSFEVTAFDASEDGIARARSLPSSIRWERASVYDEDLDERVGRGFPVAMSLDVIEHLYSPRRLFIAARRCLRPGGVLVLSTPYHGYWKNLALSIVDGWDRHHGVDWEGGHIKFFSRSSLRAMAQKEGFIEIAFRGAGRLPYLWKGMVVSYQLSE